MTTIQFLKVEGAGNDYLLVDGFSQALENPAGLSRRLSDRHVGVGADGLLLVGPATDADASMRIWNADGSEGLMCGNGLRCVVRWLVEQRGASAEGVTVATASGLRIGRVRGPRDVEVQMGTPSFEARAIPVLVAEPGGVSSAELASGREPIALGLPPGLRADPDRAFAVSIGNPHLVVRLGADSLAAPSFDHAGHGAALEGHERMPQGANVQFTAVTGTDRLAVRPWERGSGATRACGTGAVAAMVVAQRLGWLDAEFVTVDMPGGSLGVRWSGSGPAWLSGPARFVFRGEVELP